MGPHLKQSLELMPHAADINVMDRWRVAFALGATFAVIVWARRRTKNLKGKQAKMGQAATKGKIAAPQFSHSMELFRLPELQLLVASQLDLKPLSHLTVTCAQIRSLTHAPVLWQPHLAALGIVVRANLDLGFTTTPAAPLPSGSRVCLVG